MSRLQCGFGIARRAFRRDTEPPDLAEAIAEVTTAMHRLAARNPLQVGEDRRALEILVGQLETATGASANSLL